MIRTPFAVIAALCFAAVLVPAQTPDLSNARRENRAVSGDPATYLQKLVSSEPGTFWFGYAVEAQDRQNESCCWVNGNQSGCSLEHEGGGVSIGSHGKRTVKLEGSPYLLVLYRVENHAVGRIRLVSESCPLDAGGARFLWLTGVPASASLAFLGHEATATGGSGDSHDSLADASLVAIAMHGNSGANGLLDRFASPPEPDWLREKALFWLANSRGAHGFAILKRIAGGDGSTELRKKVMFDLTLSKEPGAVDELIHSAKHDPSAEVRSQALFWIAQKAGTRAAATIQDSVQNDPHTEVKTKAVFALQQLPKDQGVPLLIEVAKSNRNPEVRKQAMFWLGQSADPRALAFFEHILKGGI